MLGHYDAIVGAVSDLSAGRPARPEAAEAMRSLAGTLRLDATGELAEAEYVSNAAVMLFGGIETTEGMIANAVVHLLAHGRGDSPLEDVVEESLRLEPAAAAIDRYATADVELGGAEIAAGDLVRISITAANRDPATFPEPDRFDPDARTRGATSRSRAGRTSASGCTSRAWRRTRRSSCCSSACRGCACDPARPPEIRGLVFRKPPELRVGGLAAKPRPGSPRPRRAGPLPCARGSRGPRSGPSRAPRRGSRSRRRP